MKRKKTKVKALVLLSGGLDSMLAAKLISEQGIKVEGMHFTDPFSTNRDSAGNAKKQLGIRLYSVSRSRELLKILKKPKHGYGSQMNPCIDCRIMSLRKAWKFARRHGFSFLVTGEVLGQRPMSQKRPELMLIEKEAKADVLRPLSAKLLPETEAEKKGWVDRNKLLDIHGRSRVKQIALARKYGIRHYPSPAGGCLLTDSEFARKLRDLFKHGKKLSERDVTLLKLGRHFRQGKSKIIVGRNEKENERILSLAKSVKPKPAILEAVGYMGPTTLILNPSSVSLRTAARMTVRYSDAPEGKTAKVEVTGRKQQVLEAEAISEAEIAKIRV